MLKKEFTFKDLEGNQVTETYYFNISLAELAEMALSFDGDMAQHLQAVIDSKNGAAIIDSFKNIVAKSVGERSQDGRSFIKNDGIRERFMGTDAYNQLFMQLVTDAKFAAEFINGIMPAELLAKAENIKAQNVLIEAGIPKHVVDPQAPRPLTVEDFTDAELQVMSTEDVRRLFDGQLFERPGVKTVSDYTNNELLHMTQEEFDRVAGTDSKKWDRRVLVVAMQRRTQQRDK